MNRIVYNLVHVSWDTISIFLQISFVLVFTQRSQNPALYMPGVTLTKLKITRCGCVHAWPTKGYVGISYFKQSLTDKSSDWSICLIGSPSESPSKQTFGRHLMHCLMGRVINSLFYFARRSSPRLEGLVSFAIHEKKVFAISFRLFGHGFGFGRSF